MGGNETAAFEYAMGLFSVLIGLAVADIATSFHRLMRLKQRVRWDPIAVAAAAYTLCMAVYMWFDVWGVRHFGATRHFFFYLALVVQLFVLFLCAAASLPDERDDQVDLAAYYKTNRRYFWSLQFIFQLGYTAFGIYFGVADARQPVLVQVLFWILMTAPIAVCLILELTSSRTVHGAGIVLLFVLMILHYGPAQIN